MKRILLVLAFFLSACSPVSYRDLAAQLQDSAVQLSSGEHIFCSGVVIAKNRILTNAHCVVFGGTEGYVFFKDGTIKTYKTLKQGEIVYEPDLAFIPDLALLEVETHVAPVKFGEMPETGDIAVSMGSPLGLGWSFTLGVISNPDQLLREDSTGQIFGHFIQHDVLMASGSSGSGLFNIKGELVGMNSIGGRGIGLAVPITRIKEFLGDLNAISEEREEGLPAGEGVGA